MGFGFDLGFGADFGGYGLSAFGGGGMADAGSSFDTGGVGDFMNAVGYLPDNFTAYMDSDGFELGYGFASGIAMPGFGPLGSLLGFAWRIAAPARHFLAPRYFRPRVYYPPAPYQPPASGTPGESSPGDEPKKARRRRREEEVGEETPAAIVTDTKARTQDTGKLGDEPFHWTDAQIEAAKGVNGKVAKIRAAHGDKFTVSHEFGPQADGKGEVHVYARAKREVGKDTPSEVSAAIRNLGTGLLTFVPHVSGVKKGEGDESKADLFDSKLEAFAGMVNEGKFNDKGRKFSFTFNKTSQTLTKTIADDATEADRRNADSKEQFIKGLHYKGQKFVK